MRFVSAVLSIIPLLLATGLVAACSDSSNDTSPPLTPSDEAGADSPAASDAGSEAQTSDDAAKDDATPDVLPIEAGPSPYYAILLGSDYATTAQATLVDLATSTILGRITSDDQDTLPYASGPYGFLLHRTQGKVSVLEGDKPTAVARTLDVNPGPDAGKANPYAVVVSTGSEAYVMRYGQNSVPVIDLSSGSEVTSIDLSSFVADPDGLVDVVDGVFDQQRKRVYLVLQRIDQNEFGSAPDWVGACSGVPALVVGIDTQTHAVVDLNGSEEGQAIALQVVNPAAVAWQSSSLDVSQFLVMGVGCADADAGTERTGRGVEKVVVSENTAETSWWWQSKELNRPGAMLWLNGRALIGTDDENYARHWRLLEANASEPGQDLVGVPAQPTFDGTQRLVGLAAQEDGGAGFQVVSWDLESKATTVIAPEAFDKPGLQPYGSATLR